LAALSANETVEYITERLRVAGGDIRTVFSPEAIVAIYACSGGIPRTISVVCDNALVSGVALDQRPGGRAVGVEGARDFGLTVPAVEPVKESAPKASVTPMKPPAARATTSRLITRPTGGGMLPPSTLGLRLTVEEPAPAAAPVRRSWLAWFPRTAS